MNDDARILVATSIAPNSRRDIQRDAIASWRRHGFRVASLNTDREISALLSDFADVEFVPVVRTGQLMTGRSHVFVDDILAYLTASGAPTVGIVNSDILIDPHPGLAEQLAQQAQNGLVCCPRLDVARADALSGTPDAFGYDLFFFQPSATRLWDKTRFCLGQGYWDHYLPLMAILRGMPIYKVLPPIGRHVAHEINRDDSFFIFADEFASLASGFMADAFPAEIDWHIFGRGFPKRAYAETRANAESGTQNGIEAFAHHIDALTRYVIRFINENSKHITLA